MVMENYDDKKEQIETSKENVKAEWSTPELTVISMDQTNSGTAFTVPTMEGSFYSPS